MYKEWHMSASYSVKLDSGCQAYVDHKTDVARTMDPMYSIVAMIPCVKLCPWIGQKFEAEGVSVFLDLYFVALVVLLM